MYIIIQRLANNSHYRAGDNIGPSELHSHFIRSGLRYPPIPKRSAVDGQSILKEIEEILVPAEPNGRIIANWKPSLRDFEGTIWPITNQIKTLAKAVVIVTKE